MKPEEALKEIGLAIIRKFCSELEKGATEEFLKDVHQAPLQILAQEAPRLALSMCDYLESVIKESY